LSGLDTVHESLPFSRSATVAGR